jgi:hypothetical protein
VANENFKNIKGCVYTRQDHKFRLELDEVDGYALGWAVPLHECPPKGVEVVGD